MSMENPNAQPGIQAVLDAIGVGVWLLDRHGRVTLTNRLARQISSAAQTLHLAPPLVKAAFPAQQRALDRALAEARAGRRSMIVLGTALQERIFAVVPTGTADGGDHDGPVLLLCNDCTAATPVRLALLSKVLRLTQREADVLAELCDGVMANDIAKKRAVKLSTVRTQIASIRGKAGVGSVLQLIAKVAALPPVAGRL
jgi:DNA-binding CsgD family transcriptional regulator